MKCHPPQPSNNTDVSTLIYKQRYPKWYTLVKEKHIYIQLTGEVFSSVVQ